MTFSRNLRLLSLVAAIVLVAVPSSNASASFLPGLYQLLDHPDGALTPPFDYGLRLDGHPAGQKVFSMERDGAFVTMDWDFGGAVISGTMTENVTGDKWDVHYVLSGITAWGGDKGFDALAGTGYVRRSSDHAFHHVLTGRMNPVFKMRADGHRLPGNTTPVGRGWLEPTSSTDDWLVQTRAIPEPGSWMLLGLGLIPIVGRLRRRA